MSNSNDTFTDSDGTASTAHALDSGGSWSKHSSYTGVNEIQSNQMTNQAGSNGVDYSPTAPATAEYDVQSDHTSVDNCGGPCGRIDTASATMYLCQYVSGSSEWRLQKLVSGSLTTLGTYSGDAPSTTRTLKLQIRDATKKLFIGGVERISSADNAITAAGRPGYFMGDTSDNMDNWSSTDTSAGVTVNCGVDALTLTTYSANIGLAKNITAGVDSLSLTTYSATIASAVNISAGVDALTLTTYAASINAVQNISANAQALTLTPYAAAVGLRNEISVGVAVLTLTAYPVTLTYNLNITAGPAELTLTEFAATVDYHSNVWVAEGGTENAWTEESTNSGVYTEEAGLSDSWTEEAGL